MCIEITSLLSAVIFVVGMGSQREEGGRRILLGDNTGDRAVI
jgi:hypothetical protein